MYTCVSTVPTSGINNTSNSPRYNGNFLHNVVEIEGAAGSMPVHIAASCLGSFGSEQKNITRLIYGETVIMISRSRLRRDRIAVPKDAGIETEQTSSIRLFV